MKACECGCGEQAERRFVSGHRARLPRSRSGRKWAKKSKGGHVRVYMPEHPNALRGGYVYEHTVIATRALGKAMPPDALVHHVDYDGGNNAPQNLVICQDIEYHSLLHRRTDAYRATGDANRLKCVYCHNWERPDHPDLYVTPALAFHRACRRAYRAGRTLITAPA